MSQSQEIRLPSPVEFMRFETNERVARLADEVVDAISRATDAEIIALYDLPRDLARRVRELQALVDSAILDRVDGKGTATVSGRYLYGKTETKKTVANPHQRLYEAFEEELERSDGDLRVALIAAAERLLVASPVKASAVPSEHVVEERVPALKEGADKAGRRKLGAGDARFGGRP